MNPRKVMYQWGLQARTHANRTENQGLEESKDGNSYDIKESKNNKWQVERLNDPTKMTMAFHNGAWTCPTPFYMEDWTHRDMYRVCILPGRSGVQAGAAQHQFGWILGQCQALLNGGGPDQAVCNCDVSTWFNSCRSGKEFVVIENNCLRRI